MVRRSLSFLLVLAISTSLAGAPRRRAASKPSFDTSTPAGWLTKNAYVLHSTELTPYSYDLDPLRFLVGNASTVGLGDGTHGTHEFYTVKLRILEWLVREMNFDVIAWEGSFPIFERINQYAQGGPGDPRALLKDATDRLLDFFWNVEEMLAVIEWVRAYNLARGDKPPVEIAGFDIYDEKGGVEGVLAYLRQVDPAEAARVETEYACVLQGRRSDSTCQGAARGVHERLAANRVGYLAKSSVRAYEDALQYATVVEQYFGPLVGPGRDAEMAKNALWLSGHRGRSGRTILWAHNEHIAEAESPEIIGGSSMGTRLAETLGANYVTIGTLSGNATYRYWTRSNASQPWSSVTATFPPPVDGSYEANFRTRGLQAMLVPLNGDVPAWLLGPARYQLAGTTGSLGVLTTSLPQKFDAVIYIGTTTPTTPLP